MKGAGNCLGKGGGWQCTVPDTNAAQPERLFRAPTPPTTTHHPPPPHPLPAPQSLVELPPEQVVQVVRTNLVGTLLATRAGMRAMAAQPGGTPGHIFNLEGAGSDGIATPQVWGCSTGGGAGRRAAMRGFAQLGSVAGMGAAPDRCLSPAHAPGPLLQYATYGATKAAIAQLLCTLQHEAAALQGPSPVCVHNLSPGMVLTGGPPTVDC